MSDTKFTNISIELEQAGLLWIPTFGDEICKRKEPVEVSVLVNSAGMHPEDLKEIYIWRPTLEQLIYQLEIRQAILKHAGLELSEKSIGYISVIETKVGEIKTKAETLRDALGLTLRDYLLYSSNGIN